MPRFCVNLSMLFTDAPLLDRIDRAAAAGFSAVEVQFPYDVPARDLRRRLDDAGLDMILFNLPAGDWAGGDRGIACDPVRQAEFRDGIAKALEYADVLGTSLLNCLSGRPSDEASADATLIDNLHIALEAMRPGGQRLLIEPVNRRDVPGFWLDTMAKGLDVIERVGAPQLTLQFDIYHAQRSGGEILGTLHDNLAQIGHIQFADNPGRNEPGTGELNFPVIFSAIDEMGYGGWVGAEYLPSTRTEQTLGWLTSKET